jgi:hypothetical protein
VRFSISVAKQRQWLAAIGQIAGPDLMQHRPASAGSRGARDETSIQHVEEPVLPSSSEPPYRLPDAGLIQSPYRHHLSGGSVQRDL